MKRSIKVRGRDGAIRFVNDDYILRDGETRLIELPFMDAQGRPIIHDGHGNPAGQRPGFLYSAANEQAAQALAVAYAAYNAAIRERWRGQQSNPTQSEPQAFDSAETARAAAYADYERRITGAWRK